MSKQIIVIDGSARRKNTFRILQELEGILKSADYNVEIINLFDYAFKDCKGCEACVTGTRCVFTDDMTVIMDKLAAAEGIILSSPVYMSSVTSRFKTFADRLNMWIHKPLLAGKPVLCVSTTASSGLKSTKQFFDSLVSGLGMRNAGFIGRSGKAMKAPVEKKEVARFMAYLSAPTKEYRPNINEIILFTVGKVMALRSKGEDRNYWEAHGLLEQSFYYPCRMNPCKRLFSKFIFKMISKNMST